MQKKMRKNQCFWRFAGNIGGFGNVAKNAEMAFFSRFAEKAMFINFAEMTSRWIYEKVIGASTPK